MKKAILLIFCALLMLCTAIPAYADHTEVVALVPPPDTSRAQAVYVYHINSGTEMLAKNADAVRFPASTVKIASGLVACRLADGRLDERVIVTNEMLQFADNKLDLKPGESVSIKDMLYACFCGGSNDAAIVLAYALCGGVRAFVDQMNELAAAQGATQTVYTNPTGLHDDAMVTTAADTAKIALAASQNALYMKITSTTKYVMPATNLSPERTLHNRNCLIHTYYGGGYVNKACQGMNAGQTDQGGFCAVTVAQKANEEDRYLLVVMGAEDDKINDDYIIYSYTIINDLVKWACGSFETRQVLEAGQATVQIPVENTGLFGLEIDVCAKQALRVYLPRDATEQDLTIRCHLNQTSLQAPIKAGQTVGVITVYYQGVPLGSTDAVILESYGRNPLMHAITLLSDYVSSRAFAATAVCAVVLLIGYFCYIYSGRSARPRKGKYTRRR